MSSYSMGYFLGQIVGACFIVFIIYAVLETLIFKRLFDDPVKGKLTAAGVSWSLLLFLNLGNVARAGPIAVIAAFVAALVVSLYAWKRGHTVRQREADVGETFS